MNRFIFMVLSSLLLIFANSAEATPGTSGAAKKLESEFQVRLFESIDDDKTFALTVPQSVAYSIINRGGLTYKETAHLLNVLKFRSHASKGTTYRLDRVYFEQELNDWVLIFRVVDPD